MKKLSFRLETSVSKQEGFGFDSCLDLEFTWECLVKDIFHVNAHANNSFKKKKISVARGEKRSQHKTNDKSNESPSCYLMIADKL